MSNSINESKGTTINELELLFRGLHKVLERHLEHNPKGGIVMAKGKHNEARMHYSDMAPVLTELEAYMTIKGATSFGICKTCSRFNNTRGVPTYFGNCGNKTVHEYDTCSQHSASGGGYGL